MTQTQPIFLSAAFVQFAYLQGLDLLSTVAFLLNGVVEANPFIRWTIAAAPTPLSGLITVKLIGLTLAICCLRAGKEALLTRINVLFAALVVWNLTCLIIALNAQS